MKTETDLAGENRRLREALQRLYNETADYIRINNLGDVHHNQTMKKAEAVLGGVLGGEKEMCRCPYAKDQSQEWHIPGSAGCRPPRPRI